MLERGTIVLNRLSFRLFIMLALALFPLGLIAVYQTDKVLNERDRLRHAALFFETSASARDQRELIQKTLGAARGLASLSRLEDTEICRRIMRDFVDDQPYVAFAGYTRITGMMDCGSEPGSWDFSKDDGFKRALAAKSPQVNVAQRGAITGLAVLLVTQPVYIDRALSGFVTLSVPLQATHHSPLPSVTYTDPVQSVTFTDDGRIISASGGRENAQTLLPRDIAITDLTARAGTTFSGQTPDGEARIFAVASIFEDQASVIASWPDNTPVLGGTLSHYAANLLFPLTIWLAGLIFASYELRRVVLNHLSALRSAMRRFALGQREGLPLKLDAPPEEFAEAERAFNRMAYLITESETRQAKDLEDKEILLREVHHRVKNNLQMIGSIMNMQARRATSPEARLMLASLQRRVNGLATLHRTLYTTPDLLTIEARDLLEAVISDISTMISTPDLRIDRSIEDLPLYPDQAVPLSMLLAEALTNAMKYVGAQAGETPFIQVLLRRQDDGRYKLSVINSKGPLTPHATPEADTAPGLGHKLIKAFVAQLGGSQMLEDNGNEFAIHVMFEKKDFAQPQPPK